MADDLVLVTGASGYIATMVTKLLQEEGYKVRGTVRSTKDEKKVKHLYELVPNAKHKLELVEADLTKPESWPPALKGVTKVMHVASPFPMNNVKDENELIKPAVDGTLNVLKAVAEAGTVKRVVLTSSTAAITAVCSRATPFTENDWLDVHSSTTQAYGKSKAMAEKAAWDYVKDLPHGQKFELAVVNPVMVVGPALHGNPGSSTEMVSMLLEHRMPAVPNFYVPCIDVRDVARAHLNCMTMDDAVGHRHILFAGCMNMKDLAHMLSKEFKPQGYNVPTSVVPNFIITVASWFSPQMKAAKLFSSEPLNADNSRMKNVLGINPIPLEKSLMDMAYSLIENGFVKKTDKYRGAPPPSS